MKCGSAFKTTQYKLDNGSGKYCSTTCSNSSRAHVKRLKPIKCLNCRELFQPITATRKLCGWECKKIHQKSLPAHNLGKKWTREMREKLSGVNASNWRGGVSKPNEIARKSIATIEWRKAVFERDNYTCQECSERGGRLHADHIKPFSIYEDLRFEVSNGQTLCEPCHTIKTKEDMKYIRGVLFWSKKQPLHKGVMA